MTRRDVSIAVVSLLALFISLAGAVGLDTVFTGIGLIAAAVGVLAIFSYFISR
ncbi:MAG TPA: hypothetical protein VFU04_08685 [Solirubrobacterales bacterium]|nr:hypothetical protein [Solirubrobacterales bacterium]